MDASSCAFLLVSICVVLVSCSAAALPPGESEHVMSAEVEGERLPYLLNVPSGRAPAEGWPLVLFLHGAGERGDDSALLRVHGPPKLLNQIPQLQQCVFVAPQCPAGSWWHSASLKGLLDEVRDLAPTDPSRIYVTGISMGGYGTWGLLASYPDLFAGAVPICGGGDPTRLWPEIDTGFEIANLQRAKDVPVRAVHGEEDDIVPIEETRMLVHALQDVGADVDLIAYDGVGHDSWTQTYLNPELYKWLFAQRRATMVR